MKMIFIVLMVGVVFYESWGYYKEEKAAPEPAPFVKGVYDVKTFALNGDTLAPLLTDTIRWRDFIMDNSSLGSVGSGDTLFRRRYGRGYFNYDADTAKQMMAFTVKGDTIALLHYTIPDSNSIILNGTKAKDSLYVVLQKSNRHFQLAEKQFHWLSEYNR